MVWVELGMGDRLRRRHLDTSGGRQGRRRTRFERRALAAFAPEELARWKAEGVERYALKKVPYEPKPWCDVVEPIQAANAIDYVFVDTKDGDPWRLDASRLLALRVEGGWYLEDHEQTVPWHRHERVRTHFVHKNEWALVGSAPTVNWEIKVTDSFTGHPHDECSSGTHGEIQRVSLACSPGNLGPSCRFHAKVEKTWSIPACP